MNKKISNIFLITVLIGIIFLTIGIFYYSKEEVLLEDISGNRSELGEMIIKYQKRNGLFQTNEINISKDKIWTKYFAKEVPESLIVNENNLENREIFKYISSESEICEDKDEIATVSLMHTYITDKQSEMISCIEVKNKKTKKITYYEIPIDNTIDTNGNSDYIVVPTKDKDNIYLTILSSIYNEDNEDEYKETYLSLYKINLNNNFSKLILSSSYDGKDMYVDGNIGFSKGEMSYFVINKKKNDEYRKILFGFDVRTKRIVELDLGPNNYDINNYLIDGDEVMLSCESNESMKAILINLNKNEVVNETKLNFDKENNKNIVAMKVTREKMFLVMTQNQDEDDIKKDYYIYVIDNRRNNVLYKGKVTEDNMCNIKFGVIENK